ncbi:5-hydroxyisourate hydrolase [Aricia agestis]|uniref:5-hydroxyisourate hydrolase n=1 Tax=Aricia agestis TaxID=91739 RepID=UPI001C20C249|nr:5-hydroxyisourate hydrolase [Aricia agestis]
MSRPVLTTHVLDTSSGKPARDLFVELYKQKDDKWTLWHNTITSADGRIQFPFSSEVVGAATYKLKFNVADYYKQNNKETIYPYVEIVFKTTEGEHYHIPLILSPYSYSTYRGS